MNGAPSTYVFAHEATRANKNKGAEQVCHPQLFNGYNIGINGRIDTLLSMVVV